MSFQVVIVEDESLVAQDISQILRDEGYIIKAIASDGETAIKKIVEHAPDLVLLDVQIKGEIDGIDVAQFTQSFYDVPIIYLTAFSDAETLKRAQSTNPLGYVVKPFRREQLLTSIAIALSTHTSQKQDDNETYLKNQFLAIVSHELRTPLNAILGFAECLSQEFFGLVNPEQIEALQIINNSGNHLLSLINSILDLASIEAGKFKLQLDLTPIAPVCRTSLEYIHQEALQKRIQLVAKIPANLPYLMLDERRIFQVLINLLKNAVKFTPDNGHITIEVTHEKVFSFTENTSFIRISVIDTGIGISPDNIDKLFQTFSQVDSSYNRKYEGLGLGLAFVKRIVELHSGTVEVVSELGIGSSFTICLPCTNSIL